MDQPIPKVSQDDVLRLVRRDFPHDQSDIVLAVLAEYGNASHNQNPHRIHAAILKLANGDLNTLERQIASAKIDFRDTLVAAEYPEYGDKVYGPKAIPEDERRQIINADWQQYKQWFDRK